MPGGYGSKSIYAVAGAALVTQFSDTFAVTDPNSAVTGISQNWAWAIKTFSPYVGGNVGVGTPLIQPSSFDGVNALTWKSQLAGSAVVYRSVMWPVKGGIDQNIFGKTQFAQVNLIKLTGNWDGSIVSVCNYAGESNDVTAYMFEINTSTFAWRMRKGVAGTFSTLASGTGLSAGIYRISANLSIAGQVTITLTFAGSVLSTFTDSVGPIVIGSPAINVLVPDGLGTGAMEMRNFSCGAGT